MWVLFPPPVTTHDLGDVWSCGVGGSIGDPGGRAGAEADCQALEDGSGKDPEQAGNV